MTSASLDRRQRAGLHFGVHAVLVSVGTVVLGVPFVLLVVWVRQQSNWVQTLDRRAGAALHTFGTHHSGFVTAMRVVSDVGAPGVWWIAILPAAALLVRRGARRRPMFAVVTFGGSWVLNRLVKSAVHRGRPHFPNTFATAHGASFPSGHAQAATVACGVLLVVGWADLSRRGRILGAAGGAFVVVVVAFSRVALGVHFVSDVVAAVLLGIAWLLLMTAAFTAWRHEATVPTRGPEDRTR
ncbi:MAG: phosphatase PAP2 family protein [Actinomycetota bacterium]|nr:phosphatase PAP2 family protein [Actinomycetota bacterium]